VIDGRVFVYRFGGACMTGVCLDIGEVGKRRGKGLMDFGGYCILGSLLIQPCFC
jgi:hypothetical protein